MASSAQCPQTPLTRREGVVLDHICLGESNKEIARALHRSAQTIKNQVVFALAKLPARNRAHAAVLWVGLREQYSALWDAQDDQRTVLPILPPAAPVPAPPESPLDHFWQLVDKRAYPPFCWVWLGSQGSHLAPYPTCEWPAFAELGRSARRIAYALECGERVPDALALHRNTSVCTHPACVCPAHMKLGPRGLNAAWRNWTTKSA